jgi:hypothetical protein
MIFYQPLPVRHITFLARLGILLEMKFVPGRKLEKILNLPVGGTPL